MQGEETKSFPKEGLYFKLLQNVSVKLNTWKQIEAKKGDDFFGKVHHNELVLNAHVSTINYENPIRKYWKFHVRFDPDIFPQKSFYEQKTKRKCTV